MQKKNDNIHAEILYTRVCRGYENNKLGMHLSTRKYNRTHLSINMNMTLKENFDDNFEVNVFSTDVCGIAINNEQIIPAYVLLARKIIGLK